jgi:thiol-disulfide isomerase/thioredoxin
MKTMAWIIAAGSLWALAVSAPAAKLGDPAASLAIKEWVKGSPADVKDGRNYYVVEFWATWCGPCRTTIPHLSELQKKHKDKGVVFIGVSDEPSSKVRPFVEKMGDQMNYRVACDDDRQTYEAYMAAYGQGGIPCAFVVGKDGRVLWVGHPMAGLDQVLEEMVAGRFDLKSALQKEAARAELEDYQKLSAQNDPKARELGRKLLAEAGTDPKRLVNLAFSIAANSRNPHRDFALAEEALGKAEKLSPPRDPRLLGVRGVVLFESGRRAEGLALAKQALELSTDDRDQATHRNYIRVMEMRMGEKKE